MPGRIPFGHTALVPATEQPPPELPRCARARAYALRVVAPCAALRVALSASWCRRLLRTAGPLGPWRAAGPGRFCAVRGGGAPALRCGPLGGLASPPLRRGGRFPRVGAVVAAALFRRRSALWLRPPARALWGSGGARALPAFGLFRVRPSAPPGFRPGPPLRPGCASRCGGCAAADLWQGAIVLRPKLSAILSRSAAVVTAAAAEAVPLLRCGKTGQTAVVPLMGCAPCPSSFAIDADPWEGYNDRGGD